MDGIASVKLKKEDTTNIHKCIVCKKGGSKGGKKSGKKSGKKGSLTGTDNGRSKIISAATKLGDKRVLALAEESFVYHLHPCYSKYIKKGERAGEENTDGEEECEPEDLETAESETLPQTRSRTGTAPSSTKKKVCIVCGFKKHQGDIVLNRIETDKRAWKFLAATNFHKDATYRQTILCKEPKHVFAADVMYHGNCMNKYIQKALRQLERVSRYNTEADNAFDATEKEIVSQVFEKLCSKLDLDSRGYEVSDCCAQVNKSLSTFKNVECINNRQLKNLLIEKYGNQIGFTYPRKRNDSQMFYSLNIKSKDLAEQLQSNDFAEEFAKLFRKELIGFDFGLEDSYCDGDDLKLSHSLFKMTSFPTWERFCSILLQGNISPGRERICDMLFQMMFKMVHCNLKRTPIGVSVAQSVNDLSRSKHLIELLNRLGVSVSYDEVQREDMGLVQRTLDRTGSHRVPIPPSIKCGVTLHGATDNFDKNDNKGGSHDTILMFFQNPSQVPEEYLTISSKKKDTVRSRKLVAELPCQKIVESNRGLVRGTIQCPL